MSIFKLLTKVPDFVYVSKFWTFLEYVDNFVHISCPSFIYIRIYFIPNIQWNFRNLVGKLENVMMKSTSSSIKKALTFPDFYFCDKSIVGNFVSHLFSSLFSFTSQLSSLEDDGYRHLHFHLKSSQNRRTSTRELKWLESSPSPLNSTVYFLSRLTIIIFLSLFPFSTLFSIYVCTVYLQIAGTSLWWESKIMHVSSQLYFFYLLRSVKNIISQS